LTNIPRCWLAGRH